MHMQVILDSSSARPGSAPIWGGKKGEFRDWTTDLQVRTKFMLYRYFFVLFLFFLVYRFPVNIDFLK